jgi:hypothetical protein
MAGIEREGDVRQRSAGSRGHADYPTHISGYSSGMEKGRHMKHHGRKLETIGMILVAAALVFNSYAAATDVEAESPQTSPEQLGEITV